MLAQATPIVPHPRAGRRDDGRSAARRALRAVEAALDAPFGARANPLRHLGALAWLLFWVVAASGIYVYIGYDTRADGAYASVERISAGAFPLGSFARSLHRYASDAFALVVVLHLAREWTLRRYAHHRRFCWVSGVVALPFVYLSGVGGFWLVWDSVAQYSIVATAEWLDALPALDGLARNFDSGGGLSDRLFSLLVFLHIGIPLMLLATMWLHLQRLARPGTLPPRSLAVGALTSLAALAMLKPVASGAAADLTAAPRDVALDWFYLGAHAVADAAGAPALWIAGCVAAVALCGLSWWSRDARAPRPQAAIVDDANCNGCGRCADDCPYLAVTIGARGDGTPHAIVDASACAACGICAGACPSSTPFRSSARFATGVDVGQASIVALRAALDAALATWAAAPTSGAPRIVAFGCAGALARIGDASTAVLALRCVAQLPPSFVDYALRGGAQGVLVAGCGERECAYRLGERLTSQRFAGEREPRLRAVVARDRVALAWVGDDARALARALGALRAALAARGGAAATRTLREKAGHVVAD
jgi:coenzyme F420-reducing hydrogenase delta subunit/ferredoxin